MDSNSINGWIVLDKPFGVGSTQAVAAIKAGLRGTGYGSRNTNESNSERRIPNTVKVGHAGTLDPLASGILPIALGEATKAIRLIQDADKEYLFTVRWGFETDSGDLDGKVVASGQMLVASEKEIKEAISDFIGEIEQLPPIYSAGKINGKRAYEYAREGLEIEVRPRKVHIKSLELLATRDCPPPNLPPYSPHLLPPQAGGVQRGAGGGIPFLGEADFRVKCGKGTYVRSLARDIGRKLGCFGTVTSLRRTRVGPFSAENAISLDKAKELRYSGGLGNIVLPIELALDDILALEVEKSEAERIRQGKRVSALQMEDSAFAVATFEKKLLAIGRIENGVFKPERGFNHFNIGENDVGYSCKEAGHNT